ncbi:unnamed protein product [Vicia faba]|uniref:Uncharacterized protein n=1 Tax=Vicia faba TaxID=3906 RepID=A0AAV0Z984_VICFA|nr:unnamed protein product [Vicia faba]
MIELRRSVTYLSTPFQTLYISSSTKLKVFELQISSTSFNTGTLPSSESAIALIVDFTLSIHETQSTSTSPPSELKLLKIHRLLPGFQIARNEKRSARIKQACLNESEEKLFDYHFNITYIKSNVRQANVVDAYTALSRTVCIATRYNDVRRRFESQNCGLETQTLTKLRVSQDSFTDDEKKNFKELLKRDVFTPPRKTAR